MLVLDEPGENDDVCEASGFLFVVRKTLMETLSPITIDSNGYGFLVESPNIPTSHGTPGTCSR
ncbi:MAG: hypothetical protein ACP5G0_10980 [Desulfomonilia bacterium]